MREHASTMNRLVLWGGGAVLFCLAAILNSGGYQYGVGDQAFYIPAVLRHLNPALFPRDRALIDVQDRLMLFNAAAAELARLTGLSLPALFFGAYVAGLLLLLTGLAIVGRHFYRSTWTVAGLIAAMTLRHRITQTGVNTLEGYLHPRTIAFAIGVAAMACFLNRRFRLALAAVAVAVVVHPTTAVWFGIWLGAAMLVESRPHPPASELPHLTASGPRTLRRRVFAPASVTSWAIVVATALVMVVLVATQSTWFADAMARMDDEWLAVLVDKDYPFPTGWPWSAWALNLGLVLIVVATFEYRRRIGALRPGEEGFVIGCLTLVALFLCSVPWAAARVALAVQLQVSRVFWMVDFAASVYVVWWLAERVPGPAKRAAIVAGALMAVAFARGGFVTFVEHTGRHPVQIGLPADAWHDAMRWIARNTPADSYILADPGHAYRYGTSVRVAAERDVLLEEVKDTAIAMYGRPVARQVATRIQELQGFERLTAGSIQALSGTFGLDYLVVDRHLDLPIAYENAWFTIYRLATGGPRRASREPGPVSRRPRR